MPGLRWFRGMAQLGAIFLVLIVLFREIPPSLQNHLSISFGVPWMPASSQDTRVSAFGRFSSSAACEPASGNWQANGSKMGAGIVSNKAAPNPKNELTQDTPNESK